MQCEGEGRVKSIGNHRGVLDAQHARAHITSDKVVVSTTPCFQLDIRGRFDLSRCTHGPTNRVTQKCHNNSNKLAVHVNALWCAWPSGPRGHVATCAAYPSLKALPVSKQQGRSPVAERRLPEGTAGSSAGGGSDTCPDRLTPGQPYGCTRIKHVHIRPDRDADTDRDTYGDTGILRKPRTNMAVPVGRPDDRIDRIIPLPACLCSTGVPRREGAVEAVAGLGLLDGELLVHVTERAPLSRPTSRRAAQHPHRIGNRLYVLGNTTAPIFPG